MGEEQMRGISEMSEEDSFEDDIEGIGLDIDE